MCVVVVDVGFCGVSATATVARDVAVVVVMVVMIECEDRM